MAIVMISSMSHSGREELAAKLAQKTGWPVLSREELVDSAQEAGVKVGRLEMAMIKSPAMNEKLAREKEVFLAYITAAICEKAGPDNNLIYHGRAGHALLPGISHRLRVAMVVPRESRIERATRQLNISRDKAAKYIDDLDKDIEKWTRYVHRVDYLDPVYYDFFVNLQNMSLANAATVLCSLAEMPDFRPTPASQKMMADVDLAARARLRLAFDSQSAAIDLGVRADNGVLTVTYMPREEKAAEVVPKVLADLDGCQEIVCTMAEANLLWIQENFNPDSENFNQIIRVARRWGAAVELMRLIPPGESGAESEMETQNGVETPAATPSQKSYTGGVEDDDLTPTREDGGMSKTIEELVARGQSGGGQTVCGTGVEIMESLTRDVNYALVVIGDVFVSKGHATQTRQTRELAMAVRERLKTPVITADELKKRFIIGKKDVSTILLFSVVVLVMYFLVFSFQGPIIDFLGGQFHENWKWLTSIGVALFVPIVAFSYGKLTGSLLKLIGID